MYQCHLDFSAPFIAITDRLNAIKKSLYIFSYHQPFDTDCNTMSVLLNKK